MSHCHNYLLWLILIWYIQALILRVWHCSIQPRTGSHVKDKKDQALLETKSTTWAYWSTLSGFGWQIPSNGHYNLLHVGRVGGGCHTESYFYKMAACLLSSFSPCDLSPGHVWWIEFLSFCGKKFYSLLDKRFYPMLDM